MRFKLSMLTRLTRGKSSGGKRLLAALSAAFLSFFPSSAAYAGGALTPHAQEAARLMGVEAQVDRLLALKQNGKLDEGNPEALRLQLSLIRKIMSTGLQMRAASAKFDREITFEQQALDKLIRERDFRVAVITDANFLQLSILSTVIDGPLEQSKDPHMVLNGNRLNIVSGITVGALALLALLEQRGGTRKTQAEPNLLGQTLGLDSPEKEKLPPILWTYLNTPAPAGVGGLTRRQQLTQYWETGKVLPINIKNPSTVQQVSAFGPRHRQRCENISLLTARVTMLFDLRAMIDLLNAGLVELLQALD